MACCIECVCWLGVGVDQLAAIVDQIVSELSYTVDLLPLQIGETLRDSLGLLIAPVQCVLAYIDDQILSGVTQAMLNV